MMRNKENNKASGIGKYGSFLVITGFLLFYFHAAFNADGQNVFAPAVAERLHLDPGIVLSMNSIAGLIGVLISILAGQLNRVIGPRLVCGFTFLAGGFAYILAANAPNIAVYTIAMCFSFGGFSAALFVGFGALNANWFPKRLGSVMGLVTIGAGLSTMTYIAGFNKLINMMGVGKAAFIPGIICIIAAILGLVIHRDTPAERNINPDNVSDEVYKNEYASDELRKNDAGWTISQLLRKKETWLCAIAGGLLLLCQMGIMSQLVVRNVEVGFSQTAAIAVMSVIAVFGIICAPITGTLVTKFGVKKVALSVCILMALAMFLNASGIRPLYWISLFLIGVTCTAPPNFANSLPGSVFGRDGFTVANSVIFPIMSAIQMSNFAVNGLVTLRFGSLTVSLICFGIMILIAMVLIALIQERKYNQDYV